MMVLRLPGRALHPEPITDEEAAAMFRVALNLFRLWGVRTTRPLPSSTCRAGPGAASA